MHPCRRIVYIFDPALNCSDYYCILKTSRIYERVSIIMYCEDVVSPFCIWSNWMNPLMASFIPRKEDQGRLTQFTALSILHQDMKDGAERYDIFEFYLLYTGIDLVELEDGSFRMQLNYFGEVVISPGSLDPYMSFFAFYASFGSESPWLQILPRLDLDKFFEEYDSSPDISDYDTDPSPKGKW